MPQLKRPLFLLFLFSTVTILTFLNYPYARPVPTPRPQAPTPRPPSPKKVAFLSEAFQLQMNADELSRFNRTLREFVRIWHGRLGREFMLFGGSLLGAYRHHGFVPYDDDLDVLVSGKYRHNFTAAFAGTSLTALTFTRYISKVFLGDQFSHSTGKLWRWPFIDIFFWEEAGNVFREPSTKEIDHPRSHIFPLVLLPFQGLLLPAPRCVETILTRWVNLNNCCTGWRDHRRERNRKIVCHPCADLRDTFRFAAYSRINATTVTTRLIFPNGRHGPTRKLLLPDCKRP